MSTLQYLFGFHGRINRSRVWLWLLIVIVVALACAILGAVAFDWKPYIDSVRAQVHPGEYAGDLDWSRIAMPVAKGPVSLVALILIGVIWVAIMYSMLAVYAKRLHDRNRTAWWLLIYVGLPQALKCAGGAAAMHHMSPARGVAFLITVWVFIDLWCLRGTKGSNKYGVDPLADGPVFCEPGKPVYGCVPKPD